MSIIRKIKIGGITYDLPSGGSGTSDYSQLTNKPQINGNTLNGNKTSSQLGLASASDIPTKVSDLTNDSGFITGLVVLTYGSSTWNDFITAFNANKVVFVRCGAGTTPGASTKPILAHLVKVDYYNGNPRFAEFRFDDYVDTKTYANQDDHIRIYKLFPDNGWTLTTVPVAPRIVAGDGINYNWEENQRERTLTLSLDRASITTVSFEVVQTLPATGEANVIYLVPKPTAQTQNVYDEYIYTNSAWEKIGDTEIDLSGYYSTNDDAETDIAEGDYFPFNDVSDSSKPKKKTLWSNIKAKLKAYFDTLYASISSIPTVGNGTLTIQKNGTTVKTFKANQSADVTANITMSKSDVGLENVPNVSTNNQTPTFTQAANRSNLVSGSTLSTLFGILMKWYADLKPVAFSGNISDVNINGNIDVDDYSISGSDNNDSFSLDYDNISFQATGHQVDISASGVNYNNQYKSWADIVTQGGSSPLTPTILWTNPSPTADFSAQSVTLKDGGVAVAITNFRYYSILYKGAKNGSTYLNTGLIPTNLYVQLVRSHAYNFIRNTDINYELSPHMIHFSNCERFTTYGNATSIYSNSSIIPYQVIGWV